MPFFKNQNNLNLYYEVYNTDGEDDQNKLPILLLHGFGSSAHFFQEQIKILKHGYKLIVFDAEGHGKSEKNPNEKLTDHLMDNMVTDLLELLYLLDIDGPIGIIGHSLVGGGIAQKMALKFPDRIKFLILLNSGHMIIDNPIRNVFWNLLPQIIRMKFDDIILDNIESLLDKTIPFIRGALMDDRDYNEFFYEQIDGVIETEIFSMIQNPLNPSKIECPTLIIGAELDNYAPIWMSEVLSDSIPDSDLEIIAMTGHFGPSQRPEEYNKYIWEFLNELKIK